MESQTCPATRDGNLDPPWPRGIAGSNPAIDALILDMWDTIEFKLRALDGPSRRRRGREWGIVYLTRPGEPADPEEPATPEAPAAPAGGSPPAP